MSRRNKVGNLTFAPYNYQPRRTYYREKELLGYLHDYQHIKAQLEAKKAECKKLRAQLKTEPAFYAKCLNRHQIYIEPNVLVNGRHLTRITGRSCTKDCRDYWFMHPTEYIALLDIRPVLQGTRAPVLELNLGSMYAY